MDSRTDATPGVLPGAARRFSEQVVLHEELVEFVQVLVLFCPRAKLMANLREHVITGCVCCLTSTFSLAGFPRHSGCGGATWFTLHLILFIHMFYIDFLVVHPSISDRVCYLYFSLILLKLKKKLIN